MIRFNENLKKKMSKYVKLKGLTYNYFKRTEKLTGIQNIVDRGSTTFKTLFATSKVLSVDIRNFLIFAEKTQTFKNSFESFEEFYAYLGARFKILRLRKGLIAKNIIPKGNHNVVYFFENGKEIISLERFYKFLDALGMTSDEFFYGDIKTESLSLKNQEEINFKENLKNKIDKYTKIRGLNYRYFKKTKGLISLESVVSKGITTFKTLFITSKALNLDIRNFLTFDNNTKVFENSFLTFEEFNLYLGKRFKTFRIGKNMTARNIIAEGSYNLVYAFEGAKEILSLERFYEFIDKLGMTPDEFFLEGEEYIVIETEYKNNISVEKFNNRVYELEKIKIRPSGMMNLLIKPDVLPTLHMFLKVCRNLAISPNDFFNFTKKDFKEDFIFDIEKYIKIIKKELNDNGFKTQRYIKLDSVFLFCNEKGISVEDFFDKINLKGSNDIDCIQIKYLYSALKVV